MRKLLSAVLALSTSCLALASVPAVAEYPEKPVSFIVPFPPGDLEDVLTRMIADDVQAAYGQPAAVINKPGGGGGPFPGAVEVARAPADGYTIGSFVVGVPVVGPTLGIPDLTPDPFEPLGIFLTYPFVIAASKAAPYKTMQELADYAKSEKVILGHFGDPLPPTQVTKALARKMGFSYASDAAFDALDCNTIASGDVDVMNTTLQQIKPCLDRMTILAAVTDERIPTLPDTPTVGELEPALGLSLWNGLFVRKDTPQAVRDRIIAVATRTMESDRAKKLSEETGARIYWQDAEASKARIGKDIATMTEIRETNQ
ncbi:MAG: tripartite tricarboxylate transporter substrate binding protein [Thiothrix sp.]|nr:tripartite tricarboxylate transporter substrate binding protein [Thiothrix sp.]HPQ94682.1 tripartite tricarboxylate transporter substrate binding protein [Thiolinea sp.]